VAIAIKLAANSTLKESLFVVTSQIRVKNLSNKTTLFNLQDKMDKKNTNQVRVF